MDANDAVEIGIKIALPMAVQNRKRLESLILNGFRRIIKNGLPIDVSIYLSLFIDFKIGYELEDISEYLCSILKQYKTRESIVCYNNSDFKILTSYTHNLYFEPYADNYDDEIIIPAVTGISIYIFPTSDKIKTQLIDGICLLDYIENKLLELYNIRKKGMFLYINTKSVDDKFKLKSWLDSISNKHDQQFKYVASKEDELKIIVDKLIAARIGDAL